MDKLARASRYNLMSQISRFQRAQNLNIRFKILGASIDNK